VGVFILLPSAIYLFWQTANLQSPNAIVLILLAALAYLCEQVVTMRLTDPVRFGASRVQHIWIAGLVTALCVSSLVHDVLAKYRHGYTFVRVGAQISGKPLKESEIFMDAVRSVIFGDPFASEL
jgi:hypothetical protein